MKKIILLFIILFFFLESCNKLEKQFEKISDYYSFHSTISSSDKILIRLKKPNQNESVMNDTCFESLPKYKVESLRQIKRFEKLFENSIYTGYCCCPETNLLIDFYKNTRKTDTYFIDTIESKNNVRIFSQAFQYSFLIEKKKWSNYLREISTKKTTANRGLAQ